MVRNGTSSKHYNYGDDDLTKAQKRFLSTGEGVTVVEGKAVISETARKIMERYKELHQDEQGRD